MKLSGNISLKITAILILHFLEPNKQFCYSDDNDTNRPLLLE